MLVIITPSPVTNPGTRADRIAAIAETWGSRLTHTFKVHLLGLQVVPLSLRASPVLPPHKAGRLLLGHPGQRRALSASCCHTLHGARSRSPLASPSTFRLPLSVSQVLYATDSFQEDQGRVPSQSFLELPEQYGEGHLSLA